jgi:hypothetical protein
MSILTPTVARGKAREHNPLICGIDFDDSCDDCRAEFAADRFAVEHDTRLRLRARFALVESRLRKRLGIGIADLAELLAPHLPKRGAA